MESAEATTSSAAARGLVGQRVGDYELLALIGSGALSDVYRARSHTSKHEVTLKLMPATLGADADFASRFLRETRRIAGLRHHHIVPIYDAGLDRGLLFVVMPLLRESLRNYLARETVPIRTAGAIVTQVASALKAAHDIAVLHRNLKPENILVGPGGNALVADFGDRRENVAQRQRGGVRPSGTATIIAGAPAYLAPEELRGEPVDQRADVYALGAVLYEMLTGQPPYTGQTFFEVAANALQGTLTPPSAHNASISPELDQIVLTALATEPHNRCPDVALFATAVKRALGGTGALPPAVRPLLGALG